MQWGLTWKYDAVGSHLEVSCRGVTSGSMMQWGLIWKYDAVVKGHVTFD